MNIGDILVAKGLVTRDQVEAALEHQKENGGRVGSSLVTLGALTQEQLDAVISEAPAGGSAAPIVVERTILSSPDGHVWAAGSHVPGVRIR